MSFSILCSGGADGPTTVFFAGKLGMGWPNVWGLCIVILLLIPNIIYAIKAKGQQNQCKNKWMNCLEQVGRYGCMIFMISNFEKMGFFSAEAFVVYMFGNILLLLSYGIIWIMFFCKKTYWKQTALAVIPICVFLLCGITMRHYLLIGFAVLFGVAHLYVTNKNRG